jgi:succinate dehydrogenase/fumarate reductase-like Fe-S protein
MNANYIKLKVFRYNPLYDATPYHQTYRITAAQPMTVMELLTYIYHQLDDSLAFRNYICYRGTCLSCLVEVNGRTVRACSTFVQPGVLVTVDPFLRGRVIRDLVVDFNAGSVRDNNPERPLS